MINSLWVKWLSIWLKTIPVARARGFFHKNLLKIDSKEVLNIQRKKLIIDVSVIFQKDAYTGIQRVVRAITLQILKFPTLDYEVYFAFATRKQGYRYIPYPHIGDELNFRLLKSKRAETLVTLNIQRGDIFLGLDLAAHILPRWYQDLVSLKLAGVSIHIVVYDLLPVMHPEWFNHKTESNFKQWLKTIAVFADSAICISNVVKHQLQDWQSAHYKIFKEVFPISTISLGADIHESLPNQGLPENITELISSLGERTTILIVGTLEPRKGHQEVLNAFESLWRKGYDVNLMMVGKSGWKTDTLQRKIRSHPEINQKLYWLDSVSDELLQFLYSQASGVIIASYAEGFGLPLIEAIYHMKPVFARNIPVFQEVSQGYATFFTDLECEIPAWIDHITLCNGSLESDWNGGTWRETAKALLDNLQLT